MIVKDSRISASVQPTNAKAYSHWWLGTRAAESENSLVGALVKSWHEDLQRRARREALDSQAVPTSSAKQLRWRIFSALEINILIAKIRKWLRTLRELNFFLFKMFRYANPWFFTLILHTDFNYEYFFNLVSIENDTM